MVVLKLPVMLALSASNPVAVLRSPPVLSLSARTPVAVLKSPVVLSPSASNPVAVLPLPVVFLRNALLPTAALRGAFDTAIRSANKILATSASEQGIERLTAIVDDADRRIQKWLLLAFVLGVLSVLVVHGRRDACILPKC